MRKLIMMLFFVLFLLPLSVSAAKPEDWEPPAKDGTYDVPGKPDLKVRVFVHKDKDVNPAKGQPNNPWTCSFGDLEMYLTIPREVWKLPSTWTYRLNPGTVPSTVGGGNLSTFVRRGFDSWQTASGNKVVLAQGANTTVNNKGYDGKNIIAWSPLASGTLATAYLWYNTTTKLLVESDIIMNKNVYWTLSNKINCAYLNSYDAENIMTHEQGHWFGLDDVYDSVYRYGTMFGYGYRGEVLKNTLSTGDKAGVYAIYNP